jgi:hypothetical protein
MAANQIAVFVACIPLARWLKLLLGLGVLALLIWSVAVLMMLSEEALRSGIPWNAGWRGFWMPMTIIGLALGLVMGLLYMLCVLIVTPSTANRALGARLYMTVGTLVGTVGLVWWARFDKIYEPLVGLVCVFVPLLCVAFLVSISERQKIGPRIRRSIPRRWTLRIPAFLFYSGAGGGVVWSLLLLTMVLLASYLCVWTGGSRSVYGDYRLCRQFLLVLSLYVVGYGFAGLLLQRTLLKHWIRPHLTWGICALLMILLCVFPMIVAFFMKVEFLNDRQAPWFFGNPFALIYYQGRMPFFLTVGIVFAAVAFLPNAIWLIRQVRQFQPLEQEPTEPIDA